MQLHILHQKIMRQLGQVTTKLWSSPLKISLYIDGFKLPSQFLPQPGQKKCQGIAQPQPEHIPKKAKVGPTDSEVFFAWLLAIIYAVQVHTNVQVSSFPYETFSQDLSIFYSLQTPALEMAMM